MPRKLYLINLNEEEQQTLLEMTRKGKIKARHLKRTMILLKAIVRSIMTSVPG